ncbi:MAG: hypothetical protein GX633_04505 [Clostridiales bacterium]|nr:hypothetical protein [Clostridiales bacterium]
MKKRLSVVLIIALLMLLLSGCMGTEAATQMQMSMLYRDGEIGEVTLYPNSENDLLPCGINVIRFIFERPSIEVRKGTLTAYRYSDDSVFREFNINAEDGLENVNVFSDPETNGGVVEFGLGGMFEAGERYYFEASAGLFGVKGEQYAAISSPAYGGKNEWSAAIAPYGIDSFSGILEKVGDSRTFHVVIGGDVDMVIVSEEEDDVVDIEPTELKETGDVTITVKNDGYSIVRFAYLDKDGEQITQLESGVYIEAETEDKE